MEITKNIVLSIIILALIYIIFALLFDNFDLNYWNSHEIKIYLGVSTGFLIGFLIKK